MSRLPAPDEADVVPTATVAVTFSKAMDPSSLTGANFTLTGPSGAVPGSVSYADTSARFSPAAELAGAATYTATLSTGVRDSSGNALAQPVTWSFTTEAHAEAVENLEQAAYVLTVAAFGEGAVVSDLPGISCGQDCTAAYAANATVLLTAVGSGEYVFASWAGCDFVADNLCEVSMAGDRTVYPTFVREVVFAPDVVALDPSEMALLRSRTDSTLTFEGVFPGRFHVGDILLGDEEVSLLRRVVGITESNGQVVLDTVEASLEEVISQGTLHAHTELDPDDIIETEVFVEGLRVAPRSAVDAELGQFRFAVSTALYDADGRVETTNDQVRLVGDFVAKFSIDAALDYGLTGLQEAKVVFVSKPSTTLRLEAATRVNAFQVKQKLVTWKLKKIVLATGVWLGPEITLYAKGEGHVGGTVSSSVTVGLTASGGFWYTKAGGLTPVGTCVASLACDSTSITVDASVTGKVGPEVAVYINDLAGPTIGVDGYMRIKSAMSNVTAPYTRLYAGVMGHVGGTLKIFSRTLLEMSAQVLEREWLLWELTRTTGGTVARPVFSPATGTYASARSVAISSSTSGAAIRYTTNGSDPTPTTGNVYSGPITIASSQTLKAVAYRTGWTPSPVVSASYTITGTVSTPTFTPAAGTYTTAQTVAIATATSGAAIRYTTNGANPTPTTGSFYTGPVTVSEDQTLKAVAYKSGWDPSAVATAGYTITGTVSPPIFTPGAGTYTTAQTVTIATATPGAAIRYTTNGANPTPTTGWIYTGPVTVSADQTLKAVAHKSGWTTSPVVSAAYIITGTVVTPTFSPGAGTYATAQTVSIATSTPGAVIRYTTDGTPPTPTLGLAYGGPVAVAASQTLQALAYRSGWDPSPVASAAYTITGTVGAPVFSPGGGTYASAQTVTISAVPTDASIRYTTDGSTPTVSTGTVYSGPLTVSAGQTIKAVAYKSGWATSAVASASYTIGVQDTTPPTVVSHTPSANATGVGVGTAITVYFSENMDPATMIPANFTLTGPAGAVTGTVGYAGGVATYTPAASLAPSAAYTATVTTGAKDLAGNPLSAPVTWVFTTGSGGGVDLSLGLVAHYPLDGSANDTGGNGLHGVATSGVDFGAEDRGGQAGRAARFTGGHIRIARSAMLDLQTYTVAAWVKLENPSPSLLGGIFCYGDDRVSHYGIAVGPTAMRHENNYVNGAEGLGNYQTYSTPVLGDLQFHHVVVSYDGTNKAIWIDGAKVHEVAFAGPIDYTVQEAAIIGDNLPGGDEPLRGVLDDVRIYNRALSPAEVAQLARIGGADYTDPVTGMQFVWVPAGSFTMGDEFGDGYSREQPTHTVTLTQGFYLGKYEVTQAQWQAVMGSNPSYFSACGGDCPVERVSWNDAQSFIAALNTANGNAGCARGEPGCYYLPTEAQWEYAAKGGPNGSDGTKYAGSNTVGDVAWYYDNAYAVNGSTTYVVGRKVPNGLGLYDMSGNVWEWVEDWYSGYTAAAVTDPTGPGTGSYRVLRGGSWGDGAIGARVSHRYFNFDPGSRYNNIGFRLALSQ